MSHLKPKELVFTLEGDRQFKVRRPGRGGLGRIPLHVARRYAMIVGGDHTLDEQDREEIEAEAVLVEYLAEAPPEWWAKDVHAEGSRKRPILDLEEVDPDEWGEVAGRALTFHRSFRRPNLGRHAA